jgi:hypothetical protein
MGEKAEESLQGASHTSLSHIRWYKSRRALHSVKTRTLFVDPDRGGPFSESAATSAPLASTESGLILAFWFGPPTAVKFGPLGQHWLGFVDGATEA